MEFEKFKKHLRVLRYAIAATPAIGAVLPGKLFLWPPLKQSVTNFAAGLSVALIHALGLIPSVIGSRRKAVTWLVAALAVATVSLVAYGTFVSSHVVCVQQGNVPRCLTVGSERRTPYVKEWVKENFPPDTKPEDVTDETILKNKGVSDSTVSMFFTENSIFVANLELFFTYVLGVASLNFAVGCLARATMPTGPGKKPKTGGTRKRKGDQDPEDEILIHGAAQGE
jgi:hypothetical protein